jgi:hypothetical protein
MTLPEYCSDRLATPMIIVRSSKALFGHI